MKKLWDRLLLWLTAWGFVAGFLFWLALIARKRMSHNSGITGRGRLRLYDKLEIPPHDFFKPGAEFPCRVRHASVSFWDDAMLDVRAASIKFADSDWESPFDMEMNTGRTSLFWSAANFLFFASKTDNSPALTYKTYYEIYAQGREAAIEGIRVDPPSFAVLRYHSQTPTQFVGTDGVQRYCTYRLIPGDRADDAQYIETSPVVEEVFDQRALKGEQRGKDYLRNEYRDRVKAGPVRYIFQIQIHTAVAGESEEIFNSNKFWDEATHPWFDLAEVTITDTAEGLGDYETRMSLRHLPASLAIMPAYSIHDYNSLNYMRAVADAIKALRVWAGRTFGQPQGETSPAITRR